ncbi:nucleotide disphospho-sugar-binding domain-containing protein [Mycobacterium sp. SMC-8]|uniref:nucleotide disphospho-sugar-binding domain-containing protein n=1 Tax=Mycobacterium sp. SMC-8 TaxID=2857060 RepID=UPI0021B2E6B8|nr:nucleotide disphospho-sugar-binding domain-containing protein [Mycobacterium sp. SMC-8]
MSLAPTTQERVLRDGEGPGVAHYLLAVSPLRGHVMPMVNVGVGLQALGHDISVLTGVEFAAPVRSAGLRMVPLPESVRIDAPAAGPALLRTMPAAARRFWLGRAELASVFVEPLAAEAESLRAVLRDEAVDAVIADVTFTGVVPMFLRDAPRPPVVVCGVGPLTISSRDTPPFGMAWQPEPGLDYRQMTAVAHRVIMRPSQRKFNRALRQADSPECPLFVSDWPRLADGLLQLSVQEFEYPRSDLPSTVEFVGPVLPAGPEEFDRPPWWGDVETAGTVVHVTQGTFDNADLDQLIGPTLEALGDQDDLLIVATTGGRRGQHMHGRIPGNARIADWIPYSALLSHVDVMITNGGYGGVQYALGHGVPLVVAGETSDKAEVAARVDFSGAGIDLKTALPSPQAVGAAVDIVRRDDRYRTAAQSLRTAIQACTPVDAIANALKRLCNA